MKMTNAMKTVKILKKEIRHYENGKETLEICISKGNSKIGWIKNVSIAPIISCKGICKFCMDHCYDIKSVLQYEDTAKARARNYVLLMHDPMEFYIQCYNVLKGTRKPLWRWNVGGEIVNLTYLQIMVKLAHDFPKVQFLVFTKKHFLVNSYCEKNGGRKAIPSNLKLIFSYWPGMTIDNPYCFPVSSPYIGKKPSNWIECTGNCEECANEKRGCWYMKSGETVGFLYHGTEEKAFSAQWEGIAV